MDNYEVVRKHRRFLIEATHKPTGIRSRFYAAEHANIGRGWTMMDMDGKVTGTLREDSLADLVPTETTVQEALQDKTKIRND